MKKRLILLALCMLIFVFVGYGQNEKFQALFVYSFTRYLDWPDEYKKGHFVITIVGTSGIKKELESIASKQKIDKQPIKVKTVNNINEIKYSHIIFVSKNKAKLLPNIVNSIGNMNTVIISEDENGIKNGAAINFTVIDGKLKFELRQSNLQARNIKYNKSLTSLAILK